MFEAIFCHPHCGILVLPLILVLMVLYNVALYSECLGQYFVIHVVAWWYYCWFLFSRYYAVLHCTLKCLEQVLLRSILAIIILCSVALYSKSFEQLLLRWCIIFRHTYYGISVLLLIPVLKVLCNVALCSKCLKQLLLLCNVALYSKC